MTKLSVVITTHNNQDLIRSCLKSVSFADEIIVVDNASIDDTVQVAKKLGARVIHQKNNPKVLNKSKNLGFKHATHDWILNLDSDEALEPPLADQIKQILHRSYEQAPTGFQIPRKNIIFGKWIQHGLWYPDYQNRLFKKGQGKFALKHNHESLHIQGNLQKLSGHILHHNYQTVSQYLQKIDRQYSDNEVDTFLAGNNHLHWSDALRFPFQDFLANYFVRESYKDGLHGLVLSLLQAFYMFVVFCKIWERQGFKPHPVTLDQTQTQLHRLNSQFKYWFIRTKYPTASLIGKLKLKLQSLF